MISSNFSRNVKTKLNINYNSDLDRLKYSKSAKEFEYKTKEQIKESIDNAKTLMNIF